MNPCPIIAYMHTLHLHYRCIIVALQITCNATVMWCLFFHNLSNISYMILYMNHIYYSISHFSFLQFACLLLHLFWTYSQIIIDLICSCFCQRNVKYIQPRTAELRSVNENYIYVHIYIYISPFIWSSVRIIHWTDCCK